MTLLLGQASGSLKILKTLLKDPRKANTLLMEKAAIIQESESHLFDKKIRSHIIEIVRLKKQPLEIFKRSNGKNTHFEKDLLPYQNGAR